MIGLIAMEACASQYASCCCCGPRLLKLSASNWMNPVTPTRSTSGLLSEAPAKQEIVNTTAKSLIPNSSPDAIRRVPQPASCYNNECVLLSLYNDRPSSNEFYHNI